MGKIQVEPAKGASDQGKLDVEVYRRNMNTESEKCPACARGRDILVVAVDGRETFFYCDCGHPWTSLSDCAQ